MERKKYVIAGGGSGIGLGLARAALRQDAEVVLVGRSTERLQQAMATLDAGDRASAQAADVTDEAQVRALFERVGAFDHLVSSVADVTYAPLREMVLADARRIVESKLLSAMLLAKHGAGQIRSGGSITFTSGIASQRPAPGGAMVAAVNGALDALVRALALELAPIRVNSVSPGWVDTPIWTRIAGDAKQERLARMAERLPVRRVGQPEDIAQAMLALAGNGYITGTTLHVDGGHPLV